jgi:hypothetical protein
VRSAAAHQIRSAVTADACSLAYIPEIVRPGHTSGDILNFLNLCHKSCWHRRVTASRSLMRLPCARARLRAPHAQ